MNRISFNEFAEAIERYWKVNEKHDKHGAKLTSKELSTLYDAFCGANCGYGHLSVIVDYCNSQRSFTLTTYMAILSKIKAILPSRINRFTVVICKCGRAIAIQTADLFLITGRYIDCPGKMYKKCTLSYEYGLIRSYVVRNRGWICEV